MTLLVGRGGLRGTKIVNKNYVNKWAFPTFRKVHFLEILEVLVILEILEDPQTVENKGESDHKRFLEN